jgi:hypothetical protein
MNLNRGEAGARLGLFLSHYALSALCPLRLLPLKPGPLRIREIEPLPGDRASAIAPAQTQGMQCGELCRHLEESCPEAQLSENHVADDPVLSLGLGSQILDVSHRSSSRGAN